MTIPSLSIHSVEQAVPNSPESRTTLEESSLIYEKVISQGILRIQQDRFGNLQAEIKEVNKIRSLTLKGIFLRRDAQESSPYSKADILKLQALFSRSLLLPFFDELQVLPRALGGVDNEEERKEFCCPITLEIMQDPYLAHCTSQCGKSYEKTAIETLIRDRRVCPCCRGQILSLIPNRSLKDAIETWKKEREKVEAPPLLLDQAKPADEAAVEALISAAVSLEEKQLFSHAEKLYKDAFQYANGTKAYEHYAHLLERQGKNTEAGLAYLNLGKLYEQEKHPWEEIEHCYKKAYLLNPSEKESIKLLAHLLENHALPPAAAFHFWELGELVKEENREEALTYFSKSLTLAPNDFQKHAAFAEWLYTCRDKDPESEKKAAQAYSHAIKKAVQGEKWTEARSLHEKARQTLTKKSIRVDYTYLKLLYRANKNVDFHTECMIIFANCLPISRSYPILNPEDLRNSLERVPTPAISHLRARNYLAGAPQKGAKLALLFLEKYPEYIPALWLLAESLEFQIPNEKTIQYRPSVIYSTIGSFYEKQEDFILAQGAYQEAFRTDPNDESILSSLVNVLLLHDQKAEATKLLLSFAQAQEEKNEAGKAKNAYKRLLDITPTDPSIYKSFRQLILMHGTLEELKFILPVVKKEDQVEDKILLYLRLAEMDPSSEAKEYAKKAIDLLVVYEKFSSSAKITNPHAKIKEAYILLAVTLEKEENHFEIAAAYCDWAQYLLERQDLNSAQEILQSVLENYPTSWSIHLTLMDFLVKNTKFQGATRLARKFLLQKKESSSEQGLNISDWKEYSRLLKQHNKKELLFVARVEIARLHQIQRNISLAKKQYYICLGPIGEVLRDVSLSIGVKKQQLSAQNLYVLAKLYALLKAPEDTPIIQRIQKALFSFINPSMEQAIYKGVFPFFPNLAWGKTLVMPFDTSTYDSCDILEIMENSANLVEAFSYTHIRVSSSSIGQCTHKLYAILSTYPDIMGLTLSHNPLRREHMTAVVSGLENKTALPYLNLQETSLSLELLSLLIPQLSSTRCATLILSDNALPPASGALFRHLGENVSFLQTLDLSNNELGDEGVIALTQGLHRSPLEVLLLQSNAIGNAGAASLAEWIPTSQLIHLNLSENLIKDEGGVKIASSVKNSSSLLFLDLNENPIGDETAKKFSSVLKTRPPLSFLSLGDNKISDRGIQSLATMIGAYTLLKRLDLRPIEMSEAAQALLEKAIENNHTLLEVKY